MPTIICECYECLNNMDGNCTDNPRISLLQLEWECNKMEFKVLGSAEIKTMNGTREIKNIYAKWGSIGPHMCIDIVPDIGIGRKWEMDILRTWRNHFQEVGVPYVIEQVGKRLTLWKQQRA